MATSKELDAVEQELKLIQHSVASRNAAIELTQNTPVKGFADLNIPANICNVLQADNQNSQNRYQELVEKRNELKAQLKAESNDKTKEEPGDAGTGGGDQESA